ncbi:hypothetical protein JHW43_004665 [Diplocarpon mali]|nr:hypothetical protein JHW43_004665 [Diplocarpon mali]
MRQPYDIPIEKRDRRGRKREGQKQQQGLPVEVMKKKRMRWRGIHPRPMHHEGGRVDSTCPGRALDSGKAPCWIATSADEEATARSRNFFSLAAAVPRQPLLAIEFGGRPSRRHFRTTRRWRTSLSSAAHRVTRRRPTDSKSSSWASCPRFGGNPVKMPCQKRRNSGFRSFGVERGCRPWRCEGRDEVIGTTGNSFWLSPVDLALPPVTKHRAEERRAVRRPQLQPPSTSHQPQPPATATSPPGSPQLLAPAAASEDSARVRVSGQLDAETFIGSYFR